MEIVTHHWRSHGLYIGLATEEESPEMIDGYPNFEWIPGNSITDVYKNEVDDKSEYEHSEGAQE